MPYAIDNKVSTAPITGGVQITQEQYTQAISTLTSGGYVFIHEGQMVLTFKPETQDGYLPPVWQDGEWYHEKRPEPEGFEDVENE